MDQPDGGVAYRTATARTLDWVDGAIETTDQTQLPHRHHRLRITTVDELIDAIQRLAIRGAPALGIAGALGVALSAHRHHDGDYPRAVHDDARRLAAARPTAVNLERGIQAALLRVPDGPDAVLRHALAHADADRGTNRAAAVRAAELITAICPDRPLRILTHCHTGRLATGGRGTALEAVIELAGSGRIESVLATETRPLLQGARLTTWELHTAGVPHRLCVDSAAPAALAAGMVDCVVVGADRVAANGDVANKIGTYALAVAAARHGVPFVVVAPESTVDRYTPDGRGIVIEQRPAHEVTSVAGVPVAAPGTTAFNPAFDVTPTGLITAVVTEDAVLPGGRPAPARADLAGRIRRAVTTVPGFPDPSTVFQDLRGVYATPGLLAEAAAAVAAEFAGDFDHVVAVEARGFPLGTAVALAARRPLVLARKAGRLPGPVASAGYDLEYRSDTVELQRDALPPGARALIVDDILATGGTFGAVAGLVAGQGAAVAGFAALLAIPGLAGAERLAPARVALVAGSGA
ncbi:S-methyl-5-thioribose-1-phosphate isomerase [Dactylosporangium aurantiacum]|uniref:Methylthioribose-1-phosphate isomerase n=1 Tax=Dactylosporangium aurantiacum TaxID=35754 RepID=A0A9Q9MEF2_9ACTN|nr:S-methyl-5-thioribose-1-phosphate isomerase [Dactylosporangium aurantiacum]MDG6107070.1 S-methyl-5-thioribose-1-phosphate isomerase [Dactylosporangium aurantiacum]UWZ51370.1 S-methyl-5-thioribose-1-phosphate isomerase [Dactylosporangium aurantiacum]